MPRAVILHVASAVAGIATAIVLATQDAPLGAIIASVPSAALLVLGACAEAACRVATRPVRALTRGTMCFLAGVAAIVAILHTLTIVGCWAPLNANSLFRFIGRDATSHTIDPTVSRSATVIAIIVLNALLAAILLSLSALYAAYTTAEGVPQLIPELHPIDPYMVNSSFSGTVKASARVSDFNTSPSSAPILNSPRKSPFGAFFTGSPLNHNRNPTFRSATTTSTASRATTNDSLSISGKSTTKSNDTNVALYSNSYNSSNNSNNSKINFNIHPGPLKLGSAHYHSIVPDTSLIDVGPLLTVTKSKYGSTNRQSISPSKTHSWSIFNLMSKNSALSTQQTNKSISSVKDDSQLNVSEDSTFNFDTELEKDDFILKARDSFINGHSICPSYTVEDPTLTSDMSYYDTKVKGSSQKIDLGISLDQKLK